MNRDEIVAELFRLQDQEYAAMQIRLIPTVKADRIIGVRTPGASYPCGEAVQGRGQKRRHRLISGDPSAPILR